VSDEHRADDSALLSVRDLQIVRRRREGTDTIVSGIEFEIREGESIAIVGESGSGKSMTARAVTGLLPPTLEAQGDVRLEGRDLLQLSQRQWGRVRGTEIGLILQDPFTMLNPILRCGEIVSESLLNRQRLSRRSTRLEVARRLAEVGISAEQAAERRPFQLSGGMRQRVAIAAALARDPRILIADEPSTALDVTTQKEILNLMKQVQLSRGMSLILISHDLRVAFAMCERVYVFYAGALVEIGSPSDLDAEPLHPYTHGLLLSELPPDRRVETLVSIPGAVPTPDEVAGSCPFAPRCRWAKEVCLTASPPLVEVAPHRFSACVRLPEIRGELSAIVERASAAAPPIGEREAPALPVIQVDAVTKRFGQRERVVTAVNRVSIEVGENESVGLVGESGSGKTTLARVLVGLEQLTEGRLVIGGVPVTDWSKLSRADARRVRSTVQVVFQDPYSSLNPSRTIGWTLAEAITTGSPGAKNVGAEVARLLSSVGLPPSYAERRPVALSGGMRQRVAIARALAVRPSVLICDEPTSALDVSVQAQILNLFKDLRNEQGLAYLFITHDLSIVRQITDRVYVMYRGEIVESGATDAVLDLPQHAYTARLLSSVPHAARAWLATDGTGDIELGLSKEA
jgi:peptide/nickel transport system ATP-binding protein